MRWREGRIVEELDRWSGAIEYAVDLTTGERVSALAYPMIVGEPRVGDLVLVNTSALVKGLGTGGFALVVAVPGRLPPDPPDGPGHIVKARYTPQQQIFRAIDEQDSPHHAVLRDADSLDGTPVVVADLHSSLPAVIAGVHSVIDEPRVCYVMTDGAALPLAFSRTVAGLVRSGWVSTTITAGQAFGGDHEAVTVHSALLAAHHVAAADVIVVSQGPGNVGTDTRWGFSGVAVGATLNAVHVLGGRAVAVIRASDIDPRERHRGISHHTVTACARVALGELTLPVPSNRPNLLVAARQLADSARARVSVVSVLVDGLLDALRDAPVPLSTMGRGLDEDPVAFVCAAAAGRHAAELARR